MWSSANVLADHWAEMLSVEVQQVNEVRGVDEYLRRLLAINLYFTRNRRVQV
jgi:hypothetical protein